jgi:HEAT repeats
VFVDFALWQRLLLLLTAVSRVPRPSGAGAARRCSGTQSRWLTALVLFLSCNIARADDPRSTYLIKLLDSSSQFRVRAQAAISLGTVEGSSAAVSALIKALNDVHPAVRAAAATSLGRVGGEGSLATLRALERDAEEPVRSAARAALARLAVSEHPSGGSAVSSTQQPIGPEMYYVAVAEPATRVSTVDRQVLSRARSFIKQRVGLVQGVRVAPDSEDAHDAERVLKQRRLKGFYLDSAIVSVEKKTDGGTRVAVSVIVATYPGRDMRAIMQGAATVTGAGDQAYNQAVEGAFSGALRQLSQALGQAR